MKAAEMPVAPIKPGDAELISDSSGEQQLAPGRKARLVIPLPDGRVRYSGRMQSLSDIVEMCIRELRLPVVSAAALPGVFDFNIDFMRPPDDRTEVGDDSDAPFIVAFQSQLGLRLTSKKVPVSVLVIDHMEKVPSEN